MVRGLYRRGELGNEWAAVTPTPPGVIEETKTRDTYIALGIEPPFDDLPPKAQFEADNAQKPLRRNAQPT